MANIISGEELECLPGFSPTALNGRYSRVVGINSRYAWSCSELLGAARDWRVREAGEWGIWSDWGCNLLNLQPAGDKVHAYASRAYCVGVMLTMVLVDCGGDWCGLCCWRF